MGIFGHSGSAEHSPAPSTTASGPQSVSGNVNVDDLDEVDDGNKNIILSIIGQLRTNSDLSRITLPTFILERKSMLERITNLMQHPSLLLDAVHTDDPVDRFVQVVRWYMSGWHIAPKAVKKPLNPVLGEYFTCYWDLPDHSRAYYVAEQTSHHPPKSSYFYSVPAHGIQAEGLLLPRSRFLGNSAASLMEGVGYINFLDRDETYEITQPNIYARGVLIGNLKLEIGDHAVVSCPKLGLKVDIEFKVKGFISGTYHAISGKIEQNGTPLYEISGKWNEVMFIKDLRTGRTSEFFDTLHDTALSLPQVRPIEEQGEFESRRLWSKTIEALGRRNHVDATTEKSAIEDAQRADAKRRVEEHDPFQPKLFSPVSDRLEFRLFVDDRLAKAKTPEEREQILRSVAPFLPGDKFPADFDTPAAKKQAAVSHASSAAPSQAQSHNPSQAALAQAGSAPAGSAQAPAAGEPTPVGDHSVVDEDGDVFVDAEQEAP